MGHLMRKKSKPSSKRRSRVRKGRSASPMARRVRKRRSAGSSRPMSRRVRKRRSASGTPRLMHSQLHTEMMYAGLI